VDGLTKINNLDLVTILVLLNENILQFHVSVDNPLGMKVLSNRQKLVHNLFRLFFREILFFKQLGQKFFFNVLHENEDIRVGLEGGVDLDDVLVGEAFQNFEFFEHTHCFMTDFNLLNSSKSPGLVVQALVDFSSRTFTKRFFSEDRVAFGFTGSDKLLTFRFNRFQIATLLDGLDGVVKR